MKKPVKKKVVKTNDQKVFRASVMIIFALMIIIALAWLSLTVALFLYPTSLALWMGWLIFSIIISFGLWLGKMFDQMEDLERSQR